MSVFILYFIAVLSHENAKDIPTADPMLISNSVVWKNQY